MVPLLEENKSWEWHIEIYGHNPIDFFLDNYQKPCFDNYNLFPKLKKGLTLGLNEHLKTIFSFF